MKARSHRGQWFWTCSQESVASAALLYTVEDFVIERFAGPSWKRFANSAFPPVGHIFQKERVCQHGRSVSKRFLFEKGIAMDGDGHGTRVPMLSNAFDANDRMGLRLVVERERKRTGEFTSLLKIFERGARRQRRSF